MSRSHSERFNQLIEASRQPAADQPEPQFAARLRHKLLDSFNKPSMFHPNLFSTFFRALVRRPLIPALGLSVAAVVIGLIAGPWLKSRTVNRVEPVYDKLVITAGARLYFDLEPIQSDGLGVNLDSGFRLTSQAPVELAAIRESLAIKPAVEFAVSQENDQSFIIQPKQVLTAGTVYQISLGTTVDGEDGPAKQAFSWAYQAKPTFKIDGFLPHDKATGVPIDTGLEITFNTSNIGEYESFISITPEIKGRFEQHGRVLAFVPEARLTPSTLYTITVQAGLPVKDSSVTLPSETVARFETAPAETSASGSAYYYLTLDRAFSAVRPDEAPIINLGGYTAPPSAAKATVYKFASLDQYRERFAPYDSLPFWAYESRRQFRASTEGLTRIGEYELRSEASALFFPSGFSAGLYLINLDFDGYNQQTPLAVSDLDASLTISDTTTLLWLADLASGQPLANASVRSLIDDQSVTSDTSGLAQLTTPAAFKADWDELIARSYFLVTTADGRELLVPATPEKFTRMAWGGGAYGLADEWWSYLWTDRTLYRPTDTVNVWGILKNRYEPKTGQAVSLEIRNWEMVDGRGEYIPLAQQTVATGPFSTFQTELKLEQFKPGNYTLIAKIGDREITSKSFEIRTFSKPAYQIIAIPDRLMGLVGESVTYKIQTQFFDGTPAPDISLGYSEYGYAGPEGAPNLTTDERGQATLTQTLELPNEYDRNYGAYKSLTFYPTQPAEGDISAGTNIFIYPSDYTFDPIATQVDNGIRLDLTLNQVDLTQPPVYWYLPPKSDQPVPDTEVRITVDEIVTTKTKRGTIYDFVEKQVIDQYDYSASYETRQSETGRTDGQGRYSRTFTLTGEAYRFNVSVSDPAGRSITRAAYLYKNNQFVNSSISNISVVDSQAGYGAEGPTTEPVYSIGDATKLLVLSNGQRVEPTGRFLFVKLQNGIRDLKLTDAPALDYTFSEADSPNVYFTAIWFTGRGFRTPNQGDLANLKFRLEDRELTLALTSDQSSYAPRATVRLGVRVTDEAGQPVRAAVSLSAIDAAIAGIQSDNAATPLTTLYRTTAPGLLQLSVSHDAVRTEFGAEGGGGGEEPRRLFKDTVLFTEVATNADGRAEVEFKVPDNITAWRVTGQAVSKNMSAGQSVISIPVTRPIFGSLTMSEEYISSDQPKVIARADGRGLNSDQDVQFTLATPGLGEPITQTGKPSSAQTFTLPGLKNGQYELKLTVSQGNLTDTLIRSITVLPSRLTRATSRWAEATPGLTLTGSEMERTRVIFSDTGRGRVINNLTNLSWAYGKRLERHLASRIARDALNGLTIETDPPETGFNPLAYQQPDGGISQMVYADSDLGLSALAASRADLFDRASLRNYLIKKLDEKNAAREQIGQALLGLANLGEPILPDLDRFLTLEGITPEDQLTAALAYQALGASNQAYAIAQKLLEAYGETQAPYIRLKIGLDTDSYIVQTARFSILAESLKLSERIGLDRFLSENFPRESVTNLARAWAQTAALPLLDDKPVSLTYRVNDASQTVTLTEGRSEIRSFTSAELAGFKIESVAGPAGLTILSQAPLNLEPEPSDSRLSINRTYSVVGRSGPIESGDIIRIDLRPDVTGDVVDSTYLITDLLPSGLVLVSRPWERGLNVGDDNLGYPFEVVGQRVVFWSDGFRDIHYFARVLTPGGFTAEPSVLQGQTSRDLVNYSGVQTIEIR